jgi:hypothetical protein
MLNYDNWNERISSEAQRLGFNEGYKILYGRWDTIGQADTVFLSLNPGRPPKGADLFTLSDERGNSYEVEKDITTSAITAQFLALANLLGLQPNQILTGTIAPFRSNRWNTVSNSQRKAALAFGETFWREVFALRRPKRVICCCPEAAKIVCEILGARPDATLNSGWGDISLRRFRADDGAMVVQIPHLSTFKLLSRPQCIGPLKDILDMQAI